MAKIAGNTKGNVRSVTNIIGKIKNETFSKRQESNTVLRDNALRKASKNGPITNNMITAIESKITNNSRGSNKLGFRERAKNKEVKTAKKTLEAINYGVENPNNLSNKQGWKKFVPFTNSRSNLTRAINNAKNKKREDADIN